MGSLLKHEYAIQPNFLIFKSIDGNPVREICPPWGYNNKEQYQENRTRHNYGKLIDNSARDKQYCLAHVITILKSVDVEFAKKVFYLLDPVGLNAIPNDDRPIKGYGMHSAIYCGMTADYKRLVEQALKIKEAHENNSTLATQLKQLFVLELKQANFIGSFLYAPNVMVSHLDKIVDKLCQKLELPETEVKQLEQTVNDFLNGVCACLKTNIANATRLIESGRFAMPRDDEAIHDACMEYPKIAWERGMDKYQLFKSNRVPIFENINSALDVAKLILNDIMSNFYRVTTIPTPEASSKEFALSPLIDEKEALEIAKNVQNGKTCTNVTNADEVAITFNVHKTLGNI